MFDLRRKSASFVSFSNPPEKKKNNFVQSVKRTAKKLSFMSQTHTEHSANAHAQRRVRARSLNRKATKQKKMRNKIRI